MGNKVPFKTGIGIGISTHSLYIIDSSDSNNSQSAVYISGGASIGKSLSLNGSLILYSNSEYTAFRSSSTANTTYILPSTSPATGSSVLQSTSEGVMSWVPMTATGSGAASGFTTLNSLTSGIQYFSTGTSGSGFNISSSGSTHTFNIPIAGSGSTGLITTLAQTIAGQKTFSSTIVGDLSGIATTATNINVTNSTTNASHSLLFSRSASGSGLAVSSNTTLSYNPSSLILSVSGLAVTSTAASTSSSSGALIVSGGVGIGGSLYVAGDLTINGTTTTINSVTLTVDDKNIELGSVVTPSDVTAEGGGITLKGASDKSINWYSGAGWSSSESWNLASGNTYKINNTAVLSSTSLGTGVTNSSLTATGTITTGTWSASGITAKYGGTGYSNYTKGDLLVGLGNTLFKLPVGSQGQILQAFSDATSGIAWTSLTDTLVQPPTYGAFYSTQTQQVSGVGITLPINFNSVYESYNTEIYGGSGTSSRLRILTSGTYNIQFSAQLHVSQSASNKKADIWFRINGIDVPQSNTTMTIAGINQETVLALNFVSYFAANDYLELMMSSDSQYVQVEAYSAQSNPPRPAIPSIIATIVPITQVVGSSAGLGVSGIVSLNGLNQYIQYFATGNSGSDFNISSSNYTHTINIPIAGTGATGLLTSQAQTIGGAKTFASPIIGSLTGTATTASNINVVLASSSGNHPLLFTPSSGSASGVAISSNSTLVYNAVTDILSVSGMAITSVTASLSNSTGSLIVSGGVGIGGSLNAGTSIAVDSGVFGLSLQRAAAGSLGAIYSTGVVPSSSNYSFATDGTNLNLNSTSNIYFNISNNNKATISTNNFSIGINVNSTSTTTGSLTVTGGVGIGQSASIGGRLQLFNGSNYTAFVSSASGNTVYTLPATSPSTGSSVLQSTAAGVLSWVPMVASSSSSGNTSQNIVINAAGSANVFHPVLFTPSSLSAGSAVSSDSTISFNPSTEILNVSGLAITSGTASTNTTTGALVVRGGLGVTGQLSFATASFGFTGIATNPTMSFIGATSASPITLTVLTDNSLSWEGTSGQLFSIDNNLTSGDIFSVSDISGLPIINASAGQTVNINEFGGFTQIGNGSINSSSTTTGSLVVSGGLGVTGNANIGGSVVLSSSTTSISTTTGALIVSNGVGIGGSLYVGSASRFTSSTASLNTSSGSIVVSGGVGIGGSINVGGASRFSDTTQTTSSSTGALIVNGGVGVGLSASIGGRLQLFNGSNYTAFVSSATANTVYTLPATSPATGTSVLQSTSGGVLSWVSTAGFGNTSAGGTDGAVQYKNGSGFGGTSSFFYDTALLSLRLSGFPLESPSGSSAALKVEQTSGSFNGNVNGTMIAVNANSSFNGDLINLQTNAITKFKVTAAGAIGMSSSITTAGDVSITSITPSTNSSTGALTVFGGAGIAKTLFVGGNINVAGSLYAGTNTFVKTTGSGDINLDNGSADTPAVLYYWQNNKNFGTDVYYSGSGTTRYRIVKELNETGGAELWSIDREGIVYRSAYAVGETINTAMYNYSDLGMSATTTISSTSYTTIATISYTPKSSSSYLWIEFSCTYTVAGAAGDDFWSNIEVGGVEQVNANQVWVNGAGGGTRSGVLFPLSARYTNSATSALTITVRVKRGTSDDNGTIYGNSSSGFMRIQEIGR